MPAEILSFQIAERTFGLPVTAVREVLRAVSLTPPPEENSQLEGLVNVRGEIVPVVDVRTRLGLTTSQVNPRNCLVLIEQDGHTVAFRTDTQADLGSGEISLGETGGTAFALGRSTARIGDVIVPLLDSELICSLADNRSSARRGASE